MRHLAALILALGASACSWPASGEVWNRVHAATLTLGVPGGSCSGTAVGHYTILTAAHCFYGANGIAVKPASITANDRACKVWGMVDDGNDHVLLTTDCEFTHRARIGRKPHVGQQVFIWGSPLWLERQLRVGRMTGYGFLPGGGDENAVLAQEFAYFDLASTYGDSGSAIFNMAGEIVGVLSIGTDPISNHFHLMGALPLGFTRAQWERATL